MDTLILTLHIISAVFLIVVVLLQTGQEGMGVIFGGGSSTMFGASGAGGLLVKVTATLAAVFLVSSLVYNIMTSQGSSTSITDELTKAATETAAPAAATPPEGVTTTQEQAPAATPEGAAQ